MAPSPPDWFTVDRYEPTLHLDFIGWRTQIGNRIFLRSLLESPGQEQKFDVHFREIQSAPFYDLGFDAQYASDSAVYPLSFGMAEAIVETLSGGAARLDGCDRLLTDAGADEFTHHLHVTVDLNASTVEIEQDFKRWLSEAVAEHRLRFPRGRSPGASESLLRSWATHGVLAYEDLDLWHRRHSRQLPSDTVMAHWLFGSGDGDKDKVRDTRRKAKTAFSLATMRQLAIAARRPA